MTKKLIVLICQELFESFSDCFSIAFILFIIESVILMSNTLSIDSIVDFSVRNPNRHLLNVRIEVWYIGTYVMVTGRFLFAEPLRRSQQLIFGEGRLVGEEEIGLQSKEAVQ